MLSLCDFVKDVEKIWAFLAVCFVQGTHSGTEQAALRTDFFMGNSTSGKRVNEHSAIQMTAVYSCVRILSEALAGLPLHLYQYTDKSSKEKAVDNPLYFLLHDEPNMEMTSFVFRETLQMSI